MKSMSICAILVAFAMCVAVPASAGPEFTNDGMFVYYTSLWAGHYEGSCSYGLTGLTQNKWYLVEIGSVIDVYGAFEYLMVQSGWGWADSSDWDACPWGPFKATGTTASAITNCTKDSQQGAFYWLVLYELDDTTWVQKDSAQFSTF